MATEAEESDDDGDNENEEFEGVDAPKVLPDARAGDQIQHRMYNNCREGRSWDIVEGGCQGVQGEDDDHSGVDTGERGAHSRLGLDGCTGEGTGSREIELHTFVVINSPKGLGDCHVLHDHQQHDDGQVSGHSAECVDIVQTGRYSEEDFDGTGLMAGSDTPSDEGGNDKEDSIAGDVEEEN
ncbi:hypothetical protein BC937DRAFT_95248 [Endogone sp. FLAS-F59071]|nr:hypothetical protein BC937DRAFT_95248 [Endogone sp. FLAS-F59071]|eukprot:RUS20431.1 hypothetical protein BC937DRAFT_95248 [Endogone sp. FLAS-F59071]